MEVDRLADRHVGVVLAVHDQHRGADLRRERDRAHLVVRVRAGALPAAAAAERGFQGLTFAGRDEHAPVADPGDHDRGLETVGLPDRPGGHEPAMAGAADSEPVRVRDPLGDQQVDPAGDVAPLGAADRPRDRRREITAMTYPAPRVRQEHGVSRGREPLSRRVRGEHELVGVPVIRAAVHQRDERERAVRAVAAGRQYEQAVEAEAVRCPIGQAFLTSPSDRTQLRPGVAEPDELASGRSGMDVRRLVGGAGQRRDHLAGAAGGERVDQAVPGGHAPEPPQARVEPVDRGVEPVREQGQRRAVRDLRQLRRADGHARGQVTMCSGSRGDVDIVDGVAAERLGHCQVGQVPAAVGLPPDRRPRLGPDPAQIAGRPSVQIDHMQLAGGRARIIVRVRPADRRQRAPVRSRRQLHDVAVAEAVHRTQFASG